MVNSYGLDTSITFGFTKILFDYITKERPTHLAVAFDPPGRTFRHSLYPEYKANREASPEKIKEALPQLKEIMEALSIPVLIKEGYEADDIIGSMAKKAEKEGFIVYMATPDKDFGQLISNNIFQYRPSRGGTPDTLIDLKELKATYGVERADQIIDILTIWGDASDNVPGVRGVGEKGAKALIGQYGTVEGIYNNIDSLTKRQKEAFEEASESIWLSKKLVTIDTSVDVGIELSDKRLEIGLSDSAKALSVLKRYELPSLIKMLPRVYGDNIELTEAESEPNLLSTTSDKSALPAWEWSSLDETIKRVKESGYVVLLEANRGVLFGAKGAAILLDNLKDERVLSIFEDKGIIKIGHNLKPLLKRVMESGREPNGYLADTELMHYLIMPERSHKLDQLLLAYLKVEPNTASGGEDLFSQRDESGEKEQLIREASNLHTLYTKLLQEMEQSEVSALYQQIEMPLIVVLAAVELEGVKIDRQLLLSYSKELEQELLTIEQKARDLAEDSGLNLSSPKQLGELLYEKLKLVPNAKRTSKKNYSTNEETLTSIIDLHPIIPLILEYRGLKKLLSTYIEPLPALISEKSGKIHTTFQQALTSTGRLSSTKPNLQNIPIRTERGKKIREAFIPSTPNGSILSADYSQIELRLMAHMSGDPHFIEAFRAEKDIHLSTAAKIFHIPESEVTRDQRDSAKTANFGIIYGISSFGLSQRLSIPRGEANDLIKQYFKSYPQVKEYIDSTIEKARQEGYVSTIYGRKRYLPEISSRNPTVRGLAERNAINAPIQGSAADIIKIAMVNIYKRIKREGLQSRMVLQVHDELLFDVVEGEAEKISLIVKEEMESVAQLSIPLTVECNVASNWLEAH